MTSEITRPLTFQVMCDGYTGGKTTQILPHGPGAWRSFVFPPVGVGVFSNAAYCYRLALYDIQYIGHQNMGRVISAQSMLTDANGMLVGRAPWYAWDDVEWPADAPVGVLHYPDRIPFEYSIHADDLLHAFSLITYRAPE